MKLTDIQVTYKGGGYSGCFWEWNFFIFDEEGRFKDIGSSGYAAIVTVEDALTLLGYEEKKEGKDYFVTDLNNKESIKEFVDETNDGFVLQVIKRVNEHYGEDKMTFICPECEQESTEGRTTSWRGNGGIGITEENKVCVDCYCDHSCGYCGEYHDEMKELDVEGSEHCSYCMPQKKEEME